MNEIRVITETLAIASPMILMCIGCGYMLMSLIDDYIEAKIAEEIKASEVIKPKGRKLQIYDLKK